MPAVEVSELYPHPPTKTSEARILADARDVYNHGSTLNSVAGDVHYHNCSHGQTDTGFARPSESSSTPHIIELPPSQLYSHLLLKKGRGYPLMDPTLPNELPAEYQSHGVMIGDVGVVSEEGYFDVLFNICESADGSINGGVVPEGFVTLQKPPDNRHNYRRGRSHEIGGYIVSDPGIQVTSSPSGAFMNNSDEYMYQFQCGSREGAILALPLGASREDLLQHKDFLDYAVKHGVRWYEFVTQTLGRAIDNGSIYLITGFDKARSWGTASFPAGSSPAMSSTKFTKAGWTSYGPATVKCRNSLGESGTPPENQCIFLRGYRVTLSDRILLKVFGLSVVETTPMEGAPFQQGQLSLFTVFNIGKDFATILGNTIRKGSTWGNSAASEESSGVDQLVVTRTTSPLSSRLHPSNLINLYLLMKFPESDLTVTHDSVWCSYLEAKPEFESQNQDGVSLFEYIDARYTINQDSGAVYLADPEERYDAESPRSDDTEEAIWIDGRRVETGLLSNEFRNARVTDSTTTADKGSYRRNARAKATVVESTGNVIGSVIAARDSSPTPSQSSQTDDSLPSHNTRRLAPMPVTVSDDKPSPSRSVSSTPDHQTIDLPRLPATSTGKGGCWTCRLRRKKCDEQREGGSCLTCRRLTIDCLGWGPKRPEWVRDKRAVEAHKAAEIKAKLTRADHCESAPDISTSSASSSSSHQLQPPDYDSLHQTIK